MRGHRVALRDGGQAAGTLTSGPDPGEATVPRSRRRDRHGRGLRGPLLPARARVGAAHVLVPGFRSRADRFDDLVRLAFEELEARWPDELGDVELAVEEVPPPAALDQVGEPGAQQGLVADDTPGGAVPLGRLRRPAGGAAARVVVYRRPVEVRGHDRQDLAALVHEVVVDLVAELLGVDPEDVDPGRADPGR